MTTPSKDKPTEPIIQPVELAEIKPLPDHKALPVRVVEDKSKPYEDPTIHTVASDEHERMQLGQRRVNLMWEATQTFIALVVTSTGMFTAAWLAIRSGASEVEKTSAITAFQLISSVMFLVIGFYFGRTNHQKTGGVGEKDQGR